MAKRPKKSPDGRAWFPLYVRDWDADTAHLSCEEDGAYGRLIRFYWHNGPPLDNDAALARIVREPPAKWRKLRPILSPYFVIADGRWTHKRVEEERARAKELVAENVARSTAAAEARWAKERAAKGMLGACSEQCSGNAPTPTHSPTFGGEEESGQGEGDLSDGGRIIRFGPRAG